jgi:mercuric ion transport protein
MADLHKAQGSRPATEARRDAAKTTFATGALLAAFGVASCCALPLALGALGVGSAALVGIAVLVGPYQIHVLAAAVVCLFGAAFVTVRQRRARTCGRAQAATRPLLGRFTAVAVALALALLALTFWLEPPL